MLKKSGISKRVCGLLLSAAVILTTVGLPVATEAEENTDPGVAVKVSTAKDAKESVTAGTSQVLHISAQNQGNKEAVLKVSLLEKDGETADTETEVINLRESNEVSEDDGESTLEDTLKEALTLSDGTAGALDAKWVTETDENGNTTERYLTAQLPAGAAVSFDMQLLYRTDEETYEKKTLVRAKAFMGEEDVTTASDDEDEDNEAEAVWASEQAEAKSNSEAGEDDVAAAGDTASAAAGSSKATVRSAANGISVLSVENQLQSGYLYLDPTGMDEGGNDWTKSNQTIYLILTGSTGWSDLDYQMEYDSTTGYWRYKIDSWDTCNYKFLFALYDNNNWNLIKAGDYRRTSPSEYTIQEIKNGKGSWIYSWDEPNTVSIDDRLAYQLKEGAAFNPDDHTQFAGQTIWFKNNTDSALSEVTAQFYEKNGESYNLVQSVAMTSRDNNEYTVSIPQEACSYVQFIDGNENILGDKYSNFYGQGEGEEDVESFLFSETSKYCYLYDGTAVGSTWGTRDLGEITVYYNATLSRLSYAGDTTCNNNEAKAIPSSDDGSVYCYMEGDGQMSLTAREMTQDTTNRDLYYIKVPAGYTRIRFAGYEVLDAEKSENADATELTTVPTNLSKPCYFGDSGDDVMYTGGNRGGYWAEADSLGDAEKGKSTTVVDIPKGTFNKDSDKLYVNTTLYDYYSDYELNGNNRDNYADVSIATHRIYQPFRQFNQALSEYYRTNNVSSPLYWGNFQHDNYTDHVFSSIAGTMSLFGFNYKGTDTDLYNKFFYENNSMWGRNGAELKSEGGAVATQGLASDTLTDGSLALATESLTVPAPFFDEDFLEGNNSKNTVLGKVYDNVTFPFVKKQLGSLSKGDDNAGTQYGTVDYWYYNSDTSELGEISENDNLRLYYDNENGYFLDSADEGVKGETVDKGGTATTLYQYLPLNDEGQSGKAEQLNYGFGQKFEITFRLTRDGTVKTDKGIDVPIEFNFSGDDDVWVYIDDQLVLDVGGGHGKVTGRINFADLTTYVSAVKNNDPIDGGSTPKSDNFKSLNEDGNFYNEEHTLTMFYMERGLWESNLRLSFNFPDENEFAVEKEVDDSGVNNIFKEASLGYDLFEDASVFPFEIQNQATHYKETEVTTDEETAIPTVYNDTFDKEKLEKPSDGTTTYNITLEQIADWQGKKEVVHWKARYNDAGGGNKQKRWGIIKPAEGEIFDASKLDAYLRFSFYYDVNNTPTLNNMYIELEDSGGYTLSGYLSGKTYGTSSLTGKAWNTIQVDLSKLTKSGDFDFSKIANIKFNYNYEADIYLDDFTFIPSVIVAGKTGFVTAQKDIPSYGSVTSGTLKYPEGAVYELTDTGAEEGTSYRIGNDGIFALADGETATFSDQFRRGSYIALKEIVDSKLFETKWTLYEDDKPVRSVTADSSNTVQIGEDVGSLEDVKTSTLKDGRQEKYLTGEKDGATIQNGGYTQPGWAEAQDGSANKDTIVFRSYAAPDNETALTKLKAKFINTVKTGTILIKKDTAEGSDTLNGEYTFQITFTNLVGLALEQAPVVVEYMIKAGEEIRIEGIPAGTVYTIEEISATDDSVLKEATFQSNNMESDRGYDNTTKTVEGKMVVFGTEDEGTVVPEICKEKDAEAVVTFSNTLEPAIDITLTKEWDQMPNDLQYPDEIKVQLQRRTGETDKWEIVDYEGLGNNYVTVTPDYNGKWSYEFKNLSQYKDYQTADKKVYEYRIVELDEDGKVIESGGYLDRTFKVTYGNMTETSADSRKYEYTITNTYSPEGSVTINKENESGDSLAGAEFVLYEDKDKTTIAKDSSGKELRGFTDDKGQLVLDNIPAGTADNPKTYYLFETKTSAGYVLLKDPIEVTLPFAYTAGTTVSGVEMTEDGLAWDLTYTIVNDKAFDLPKSGLKGVGPLVAVAVVIIAAAGAGYMLKEKQGRRVRVRRRRHRPH